MRELRTRHDWSAGRSLAATVVVTVATVEGRDPMTLPPLTDAVDPDSLDALLRPGEQVHHQRSISFPYADSYVTVFGDGEVVVRPLYPF